ncbi:MAG TPA: TM2 domain-containing protein [Chitinophagaceae bacterium]|nr:TM2 domain-containing protein [Chitinophagaceae bacterium]
MNNTNSVNPVLLRYLYDITPEEMITINSRTQGFSDDELTHFCMIYRSKRKDPQTILLLCLLGFVGVSGVHRFLLGQIGMGILYFFTGGLCLIGTIIDAINHKDLATEYNGKMIAETLTMLNMVRR